MTRALAAAVAAALLAVATAGASETRPTLSELEREVVCPTCRTTLDQSNAPVAERMRDFILRRIAAGDTKSEIKAQLVANFGPGVIEPAPPKRGFGLLAWVLPLVGTALAVAVLGVLAWRWSRGRDRTDSEDAEPPLDPGLERRLDDELARFET